MSYQWDSILETGYKTVDNQHKQLVAALNALIDAGRSGKGDEAVMETMDFLIGYTIKHFSDEEKQRILTVAIKNSDNPWYSTTGGNNTRDKLFLLSIDEVLEYFGDSGKLANETLADVNSGEICDQYDSARVAYNTHGFPATWALRTPGASNDEVAFIADDDYLSGSLCVTGREVRKSLGIRPAMWVCM